MGRYGSGWTTCSVCTSIHFPASASDTPCWARRPKTPPGLWTPAALPTQGSGDHDPNACLENTRSDDPDPRFPRPLAVPEPSCHSTILTPQRQNTMQRKGTRPKSASRGARKGTVTEDFDRRERPLWRGSISLETQSLRSHMFTNQKHVYGYEELGFHLATEAKAALMGQIWQNRRSFSEW